MNNVNLKAIFNTDKELIKFEIRLTLSFWKKLKMLFRTNTDIILNDPHIYSLQEIEKSEGVI